MIRIRSTALLLALMIVHAAASAQISWQVPSSDFYGIGMRDPETYVAVGDLGKIMVGDSGGRHWSFRDAPTRDRLQGVAFGDRYTGVIVGLRGTILRTTNGGDSWLRVVDAGGTALNDVTAISRLEYIAVGTNGRMMRSTDAGASWSAYQAPTTETLTRVAVRAPRSVVVLIGTGATLKSDDGGASWTASPLPFSTYVYGLDFLDSTHGVVVGYKGAVAVTSNGGTVWTGAGVSAGNDQLRQVCYLSPDTLISVGFSHASSKIMLSVDGGRNWSAHEPVGLVANAGFMAMAADRRGGAVAVGLNGLMMRTSDRGMTWSTVNSLPTTTTGSLSDFSRVFNQVAQADSLHPFATGPNGQFHASTDGGITWTSRQLPAAISRDITGLIAVSKDTVIALSTGTRSISTDGGSTWTEERYLLNRQSGSDFGRIEMAGDSIGYARYSGFTIDSLVWRTTDRGATWQGSPLDSASEWSAFPRAYSFPTPATGYVTTFKDGGDPEAPAFIYKTIDSGRSWKRLYGSPSAYAAGIHFRTPTFGLACGADGLILRTTDGGEHWTQVNVDTAFGLWDVRLVNDTLGYAVGNHATILETTDAGLTWRKIDFWKGTPNKDDVHFTGVFSDDGRHVYVTGPNALAIKDFGEFTPASRVAEEEPRDNAGWIMHVAPNPVHRGPVTITLPGRTTGRAAAGVEIVDIRGVVVARLSESHVNADGLATYRWDASEAAAGIYIARPASGARPASVLIRVE